MSVQLSTIVMVFGSISALLGAVAAALAIRRHFVPEEGSRITNPPNHSENGGRLVTLTGYVTGLTFRSSFWIAVQPGDCRESGEWWPQNHELTIQRDGSWLLERARLGRMGDEDVGKSFTIGLFRVKGSAKHQVRLFAERDHAMKLPAGVRHLSSVEIRRVKY